MVGDNMYGRQGPGHRHQIRTSLRAALGGGRAVLRRPRQPRQAGAPATTPFNMDGERYYTFVRQDVRFFVLDTNMIDRNSWRGPRTR